MEDPDPADDFFRKQRDETTAHPRQPFCNSSKLAIRDIRSRFEFGEWGIGCAAVAVRIERHDDIKCRTHTSSPFIIYSQKFAMAYLLPHLHSGWEVDQAIITEEDRVVVIRFGHDEDPTCMVQDEVLMSIADKVKNFAVIYLVDITEVPDFNNMYELFDDCTTMFFYRNVSHALVS